MKRGKMEKSVQITFIITIAVVFLGLIGYSLISNNSTANTVNVQGFSNIKAVPDLVSVYFNVEIKGATAQEAKDKNAEIVDNILTSLIKQGFERKDIVTENFNVYPEYSWSSGSQKIIGYRATHSILVKFSTERTNKIGDVIDAGVNAGALISYINFELSQEKQNEYKAEALKLASEDAKIKAQAIASGLGKKLGSVVSISSSEFDYNPWRLYDYAVSGSVAEAKQVATNIQPGEKDVSARVSVVYKIR